MVRDCAAFVAILVLAAAGCTRPRHYELRGQVVAVDPARQQITIRHEDIRGFMPGKVPPPPPSPDLLEPRETVPDPPLVDEAGTPRRLSDWKGRVLAVTFTYTRCPLPNFCPLRDRNLAAVQRAMAEDATLRTPADLLTDLRTTSAHR
jgi:hypothetical protein